MTMYDVWRFLTSLGTWRLHPDTPVAGEPAVLAVVISTGLGYMREDGVAVVSVRALGPCRLPTKYGCGSLRALAPTPDLRLMSLGITGDAPSDRHAASTR